MARMRQPPPPDPQPANLKPDQIRQAIPLLERRISDLERFDPQSVSGESDPAIEALEQQLDRTLVRIFGHNSREYHNYSHIASMGGSGISFGTEMPKHTVIQWLERDKNKAITLLQALIEGFKEELEDIYRRNANSPTINSEQMVIKHKVFLVHGHDEAARESAARFLEKLGLETIILHEQPNRGMTIIDKFETYAGQVGFAVVLLTPDDLIEDMARARQNVIFELGYFVGKIGRGKVCLLRKGDVEEFSDFSGVIYNVMDGGDGWKLRLARELKAAQIPIDLNKAIS